MTGLFYLRHRLRLLLPALLLGFALLPVATAQGTRLWTQSELAQFEKGTPEGIELASDGSLRQGAGLKALTTTASSFVWSIAVGKTGTIYLGTGSPATVQRIDPVHPDKPFTLFESKDANVQVVRMGPDGNLYSAVLPSGRVYRLNPAAAAKVDEATATVIFDPEKLNEPEKNKSPHAHYVWDLTFDAQGRLLIATGNPAAVYRIDLTKPNAKPEEFFHSDEAHIRSLAWDAKGNLIAGSDGSGLVYRIDAEGHGYVLFEAPRREVTSVAVAADGTIYAACAGDKGRISLPPLAVPGAAGGGAFSIVQPGSIQSTSGSASLPDGSEIFALTDGQAPRRLWAAKDQIVYALLSRPEGLLALTGNHGHLLRIEPDGSYADLAHLDAQQVLSFAVAGDALLLGTGNTGRLFSLGHAQRHEYASQVLDAGALARFGRVEVEPGSKGFEILTRTGNVAQPVRGWSAWLPLKNGVVASPAGRYLQWKAVLKDAGLLSGVGVNYLPVNAAPVIDELVVVPGARVSAQNSPGSQSQTVSIALAPPTTPTLTVDAVASAPLQAAKDRTAVTARWAAHDDNGDELIYSLYLRGDGESIWRLVKERVTEKAFSFDATQLPDGGYQLKVVASDAPSHTPGDALTAEKISSRFEVDTTAPVISNLKTLRAQSGGKPSLTVTFNAEDAASPILRAEYSLDAGPWQFVEPTGKLSDSLRESYAFSVDLPGTEKAQEHLLTVRVYDRHENVGLGRSVVPTEAK